VLGRYGVFLVLFLIACGESEDQSRSSVTGVVVEGEGPSLGEGVADGVGDTSSSETEGLPALEGDAEDNTEVERVRADITAVVASGAAGAYTFSVTVSSPDTGCDQYADWWEVLDEEGQLLYRRVLLHSHVGEQPFTRSGGAVAVAVGQIVWVRAHMNTSGYGGVAFKGSVQDGFVAAELAAEFAAEVVEQEPLPFGCDF